MDTLSNIEYSTQLVHTMNLHYTLGVLSPLRQQHGMWAPLAFPFPPFPPTHTHHQGLIALGSSVLIAFIPPPSFHAPPANSLSPLTRIFFLRFSASCLSCSKSAAIFYQVGSSL